MAASAQQTLEQWIREGRTLVSHKGKTPVHYPGSLQLAEQESHALGLTGAIRLLFIKERYEGWMTAGAAENATQQGFFDEIIKPFSLGLLNGPGASSTKFLGPATPNVGGGGHEAANVTGGAEQAENAISAPANILEWLVGEGPLKLGVELLLILAGLALLVYGVMVAVRPRERALSLPRLPVPVPLPI